MSINPPLTTTNILINTLPSNKIVQLPSASTIAAGHFYTIKDICGNAFASSIYISTTGVDVLEGGRGRTGILSTIYGSVTLASDGLTNWMVLQQYVGLPTFTFQGVSQAFSYTGANQTFTVPSTTTRIRVYLWGAGGGSGGDTGGFGGAGAMVQGELAVTPGQVLTVVVGQGGLAFGNSTTFGGGGAGTASGGGTSAAGGGRSALSFASADLVTAGGGGGGSWSATQGGKATFSGTADNGSGGATGGKGGSQSAGGAAGTGSVFNVAATAGTQYQGGNGSGFGGGGGGGYFGGGGGSSDVGAGGGGGSSYITNISLIAGQAVLGFNSVDNYSPPNSTSPFYAAGVATGASKVNAGGNGRVVIYY